MNEHESLIMLCSVEDKMMFVEAWAPANLALRSSGNC